MLYKKKKKKKLHFGVIGDSESYLCFRLDSVPTWSDGSFAANFTGSCAGVIFKEKQCQLGNYFRSTGEGKHILCLDV